MATEARDTPELLATYGPLRAYPSGQRLDTTVDPDRLVKTHCCFCGQQCGIQLKVKENQVVGFEPWLEFPFNKGMLCPKGIRRYLQSSHHDRLTAAQFRDQSRPEGFRPVPYDEAIRRVASEIQRIQSKYGNDAFAVLGGASMTTEKCYLLGKFFHIFQRPAQLGVKFYRDVGGQEEPSRCARCGGPFATPTQVRDLIQVEAELGYDYALPGDPAGHYQHVCPACRRKMLGLAQGRLWAIAGSAGTKVPASTNKPGEPG